MPRTTFYGHMNAQVSIQPNIGLDATDRQSVIELLNLILADESVLLLKTQRGDGHADADAPAYSNPDLHALYETQSKQIHDVVLEVTERVWILGGSPLHNIEQFTNSARLGGEGYPVAGIVSLLADQEAIIRYLRDDAQKCSEMYEDQGTYALLVSVLRMHEKMAWLLRSNITPGYFDHEK